MPHRPQRHQPHGSPAARGPAIAVHPERANANARGYGRRWQYRRGLYLQAHPLCVCCAQEGRTEAATVVDHIVPHKGDERLFNDEANWQALCKPCHDRKTAREDGGFGRKVAGNRPETGKKEGKGG